MLHQLVATELTMILMVLLITQQILDVQMLMMKMKVQTIVFAEI